MRRPLVRSAGAILLAALAPVLASCANSESPINRTTPSGSGSASAADGVQQITLVTGDDYRFHPSTFTVHPGKLRLILDNTGKGAPHDFQVSGFPATFVPLTAAGQEVAATFTVPPLMDGKTTTYEFVCTIHVRQGQIGKMIVAP